MLHFSYFVPLAALKIYEEKKVLQQVAAGNEQAFRELLFRYAGLLGTYVFRLTRSRESAEEIVQDVFLKIWMSREVLAEVENFRAYLFVISRNQALNVLRKMARENELQKEWEKSCETILHDIPEVEATQNPAGLIDLAIDRLPQQQQRTWLLSRQQGLTHKQIAVEMQLSCETVKKYIMYANQSIARFIKSHLSI